MTAARRRGATGSGRKRRYLILCHDHDESALWLHARLAASAALAGELVCSSQLELATRWTHRLGADDPVIEIALDGGRILRGETFDGVLNRLITAPMAIADHADEDDRDYARAEAMAFAMSWLACLPNVLNPPTPRGLSGAWRHVSEWAMLAAAAGLSVPPYLQTEQDGPEDSQESLAGSDGRRLSVILFRDRVFGPPLPGDVAAACRRLAAGNGSDLLEIELYGAPDSNLLSFARASPWPDLRIGGLDLVAGLQRALAGLRR